MLPRVGAYPPTNCHRRGEAPAIALAAVGGGLPRAVEVLGVEAALFAPAVVPLRRRHQLRLRPRVRRRVPLLFLGRENH